MKERIYVILLKALKRLTGFNSANKYFEKEKGSLIVFKDGSSFRIFTLNGTVLYEDTGRTSLVYRKGIEWLNSTFF